MAKKGAVTTKRPVYMTPPEDLVQAKESLRDRLFQTAERIAPQALALRKAKKFQPAPGVNLVGVGVGEKVTGGARTGELCVKILVAKKFPKGRVGAAERIPVAVDGIPTDVEEVGYPIKHAILQRQRHRPVLAGVSAGLDAAATPGFLTVGTLGVFVTKKTDPSVVFGLSNNHVFADENAAPIGSRIVQPGTLDGGKNSDRVATLAESVPLKFENKRNWMDAALAKVNAGVGVDKTILGIGAPTGAAAPSINLVVRKSGRTTGLTEGIVRVLKFDVFNIEYDGGMVRVDDVMVIEGTVGSFSDRGDSGSAIVDPMGRVVGLLFAGSSAVTYAIPIRRVLTRFKAKIAL